MKLVKKFSLAMTPLLIMLPSCSKEGQKPSGSRPLFDSGEHMLLGDMGLERACAGSADYIELCADLHKDPDGKAIDPDTWFGSDMTYGDMVALSGDFIGTPDDLMGINHSWHESLLDTVWWNDIGDIQKLFRKEVDVINQMMHDTSIKYPDFNAKFTWESREYVSLALINGPHFGWNNMKQYVKTHGEALDIAASGNLKKAIFYNGFADHFLTDGFSAGHIRVPRDQITRWANNKGYPSIVENSIGGALVKSLHDHDGALSLDPNGLAVTNALGQKWFSRTDGELFKGQEASDSDVLIIAQAVEASVREVFDAYLKGVHPEGVYKATQFIPWADMSHGSSLADKFSRKLHPGLAQKLYAEASNFTKIKYFSNYKLEHLQAMMDELPQIMKMFVTDIKKDLADPALGLKDRLPKGYVDAYQTL